jgi:tRNA modification GTPase
MAVSARTGTGLDALRARLAVEAARRTQSAGTAPLTRSRHRAALGEAERCLAACATNGEAELRGENLRLAVRALGRITGRVGVETILDSVFRQFCIGK